MRTCRRESKKPPLGHQETGAPKGDGTDEPPVTVRRALRSRVDPGASTLALALGDVIAILVFASLGAAHHGDAPLVNPSHVGWIAAPFLLGWAGVALVGGLYTRAATSTPRRAISWSVPAWIAATLIGQGLRATSLFPGGTALTFVLVTVFAGGSLIVGWRLLAALILARWRRDAGPVPPRHR